MLSVLAVIAGYAIFAVSAVVLFSLSGRDPHQTAGAGFMAFSILYGACFALLGGFVAARIARGAPVRHALAVAVLIAAGATVSLLARPGAGLCGRKSPQLCFLPPRHW
jgi:FtsH-binding integral membrane protein